ncbi:hypothetical protein ACQ3I4_07510 [Zafaria sp. Z1313]|uniref:hypothetical protein n=1 Tax=Zafaria sp. Z1313 TaxID=3423202 RepID=UPI003D302139
MSLTFAGPAPGRWLADALAPAFAVPGGAETVAGQVPRGYEAYARVFHPARDDDGAPVRWADIAALRGTVLHGGAQFAALAGLDEYGYALVEDAWDGDAPEQYGLPQPDLGHLAAVLAAHTTTPGALYLGLWPGYGWVRGGDAVSLLGTGPSQDDAGAPAGAPAGGAAAADGLQERLAMEAEAKRPAFGPEVLDGPQLSIGPEGYRSYLVFEGTSGDLAAPLWKDGRWSRERQAPNLAWPRDRAWVLSTELYEDSTIIAGSAALVRELSAHAGLEVCAVDADTGLGADADRVNAAPDPGGP